MTKYAILKSLVTLCTLITILSCSPTLAPSVTEPESAKTVPMTNMDGAILRYVNEHRHSLGLASLQLLAEASKQAYTHSRNMAGRKTGFGHDGFNQRIQAIKQHNGWITASAENVAYGRLSAKEVVKGWLNSPGHKKNIEGNYTLTGIGVYTDRKGIIFFTQIFVRQ